MIQIIGEGRLTTCHALSRARLHQGSEVAQIPELVHVVTDDDVALACGSKQFGQLGPDRVPA
jgi:hypothetical protein